jgi:hypothetical protein
MQPSGALDVGLGISQGTLPSIAPSALASIPSEITTSRQSTEFSPVTNPSNTSTDTYMHLPVINARNVEYDYNEEGQPLRIPQSINMLSVVSTSDYDQG